MRVAFPIRKGILKRVVDHNVVVNNISFTLHSGSETLVWSASQDREKHTGLALLRLIRPKAASYLTVNRWIR